MIPSYSAFQYKGIDIVACLVDLVISSDIQLFISAIGFDNRGSSDLHLFDGSPSPTSVFDRLVEIDHIATATVKFNTFIETIEERSDAQ